MNTLNRNRRDVVVVGGRVAGSAAAMLLARLGHDVVVVDQASFPSDTVSTHSIARSGVVQLRRWGLLDAVLDSGAPAIRQVTFHAGGESASRALKHKAGVDLLVAPRRYALDSILAVAAQQAGAAVRHGVTVTGVRRDQRGRVAGIYGHDRGGAPVDIAARYVIGADGLRSRVARSVGAAISEARPSGGAAQYAYYAGIRWTGMELFVAERSFAGVFPTHDGQACIWVCTPAADAQAVRRRTGSRAEAFSELLEHSAPQLAERLRHASRTSPVQGVLRQPNQVRQASGPGWALVGDAGYHRDAITAHGISDAFRDAELLAVAVDRGLSAGRAESTALACYQQQRDQALREIFEITCRLAAYPAVPAFIELQKQLSAAIDKEAAELDSGRPQASACWRPPDRLPPPGKEATAWTARTDHNQHNLQRSTRIQRRHTQMSTTETTAAQASESTRNGVDTATLFATLDAVKQAPEAARFQFRAHNQWVSGTHNRSTIADYFGVGEERTHERTFVFDADHPAVLVGQDHGPTAVEFVLHALAACLTAGLANIAAARRVRLTEVRSTVTGDINLNGILGLNPDVRNGYEQITVRFTIKGDAPAEKLREIVEQSRARSAVYDIITSQVPVTIEVDTP